MARPYSARLMCSCGVWSSEVQVLARLHGLTVTRVELSVPQTRCRTQVRTRRLDWMGSMMTRAWTGRAGRCYDDVEESPMQIKVLTGILRVEDTDRDLGASREFPSLAGRNAPYKPGRDRVRVSVPVARPAGVSTTTCAR